MDLAVNKQFKEKVRFSYQKWRAAQIVNKEVWAKPTRPQALEWVLQAWHDIPGTLFFAQFFNLPFPVLVHRSPHPGMHGETHFGICQGT